MESSTVERLIIKLKKAIKKELNDNNYNDALILTSITANVLYQTNIRYIDEYIEEVIGEVGTKVCSPYHTTFDEDKILFYDGFGFNDRGLVQIYLKALCDVEKDLIYVTYSDRKDEIPDIKDILVNNNAQIRLIERSKTDVLFMIEQLNKIIYSEKAYHFFFYSLPDDVVATSIMCAYDGIIKRYQINLTDHAYWIGASCCDKCINFREYGANISYEYRKIPQEKNVIVPFYPIVNREKNFMGYPFDLKEGQRILFSGGQLYKTLSDDNKYYKMVEYILKNHNNVVFWYAGHGDDRELKKIIAEFPDRAYHTEERDDLFQVLEKSDLYISTYPICGGLMFQYAALAGLVPLTLSNDEDIDGFLINQENIGIKFDSMDGLFKEVDELLSDYDYYNSRSEIMRHSVIAPSVFNYEIKKVIDNKETDSSIIHYKHVDVKGFAKLYIDRLSVGELMRMITRGNYIHLALRHFPVEFIIGKIYVLYNKVRLLLG